MSIRPHNILLRYLTASAGVHHIWAYTQMSLDLVNRLKVILTTLSWALVLLRLTDYRMLMLILVLKYIGAFIAIELSIV
jgi:hypothetical protein